MHLKTRIKAIPTHAGIDYLGAGCIAGTKLGIVTREANKTPKPSSEPIYLFDAETMQLLKVRWSTPSGNYLFRCLNESKKYLDSVVTR